MQEQYIDTSRCLDEQGAALTFRYYTLTEEVQIGSFACEHYGIRVEQVGGASAEVRGITLSATRLKQLTELLVNNAVTPTNLPEVISDWL